MNKLILNFMQGLRDSVRIDAIVKTFWDQPIFFKNVIRLCFFNLILYGIPAIMYNGLAMMTSEDTLITNILTTVFTIIYGLINTFGAIVMLFYYYELINQLDKSNKACSSRMIVQGAEFSPFSAIVMLTYYFSIQIVMLIIDYTLANHSTIAMMLNFMFLTIYHGLYCFNNLWQYFGISIHVRIDIHEKLWPYYSAYGILASVIYLYCGVNNMILMGVYNIYIGLLSVTPFIISTQYPSKNQSYPKLNLSIFMIVSKYILIAINYICEKIQK